MITLQSLIEETFVGKTLAKASFHEHYENNWDALGNFVPHTEFMPFGKTIVKVAIGTNDSGEDVGLLITVKGYDNPFFFYNNEELTIE
jgi:hypothetical protein